MKLKCRKSMVSSIEKGDSHRPDYNSDFISG